MFFGGRNPLLGFYSRTAYLPDPTIRYTIATIRAQYLYASIPNFTSNVSYGIAVGRFHNLDWVVGGEIKNKICFSRRFYNSYLSYPTTGEIQTVEECLGVGIIQKKYVPPIVN